MLHWHSCRFAELGVDNLYDLLALRCEVFIVEQVAYQDVDGKDRHCSHLLGRDAAGVLRAYLRVVDPGISYDAPSLGRVVLHASQRGTGLADELVRRGLALCEAAWPGQGVRISAQAHLQRLYGRHGFAPEGELYLEDGIPHIEMWRAPR